MTKTEFIEAVAKAVQKYAPKYGIAVCSPIIAQACLESAYGTSDKAKYHNYFGLKYRENRITSHNGFFTASGSEQNNDGTYRPLPNETKWYSFENIDRCVEGYFQFINISNYKKLKGEKDPKKYLEYIKAAGYATSQKYVENVYKRITEHNLTKYDNIGGQKVFKVAIDAGHGSNTGGKRHPDGFREHYSNVYIAYYLDQLLTKNGIDTLKVSWDDDNAKDDSDVALATRQKQIKTFGADISVSIHANAHGNGTEYTTAEGIETFYHSDSSSCGDSIKLAEMIHKELINGTTQVNRGIKKQNLAMCNCTKMGVKAAVLVETGFMTNKKESELLKTDMFWRECAREIATGIFNYFGIHGNTTISLVSITGTVLNSGSSNSTATIPNTTIKSVLSKGQLFKVKNMKLFASASAKSSTKTISGKYWIWSNEIVSGRIRLTNAESRVGISGMVTGWVNESDLLSISGTSATKTSAFVHNKLDYSPIFNPTYYASTYPDVKKAYGTNQTKLFKHFIDYGMTEGRKPCEHFDVQVYMNRYSDLKKAFGNNLPKYYEHYIQHGLKEGRKPY